MDRLNAAQLAAFERDGFVPIDNVVPRNEVDYLRQTLLRLHEDKVGFEEGAQFDAVGLDDGTEVARFPQIVHPRVYAPDIAKTSFYSTALVLAKQILGDTARFKADISLLKPALIGSNTPWHQDEAFANPAFNYNEVSIWLALTPAGPENSCMSFIPGSHKSPVYPHRPLGGDPRIHTLECVGDFDPTQAVTCPLSPGGMTLHHQRTLHCAGPNISTQARLAYVLIFDVAPTPCQETREFPWNRAHFTARTQREQRWRRHGGMIIHAWRQRHRLRLDRLLTDLRRARDALRGLVKP